LISFFAERVNLCKGRWEPAGSTATAYIWLVWAKDSSPRAPYWIPPGCREALTKPDDAERFTLHPVPKIPRPIMIEPAVAPALVADDTLEVPSFLKRAADNVAPFVKPAENTAIGDPHAPHH